MLPKCLMFLRVLVLLVAPATHAGNELPANAKTSTRDPSPAEVWVTWKGAEPDKGASAWYLKRFVRHDVRFREVDAGVLDLGAGMPFDVPQADFRRTHKLAVYEQLLLAYPVTDPVAKRIGDIIHDIEINLWRPKKFVESAVIETAAMEYAKSRVDGSIPLSCYVAWFELIHSKLQKDGALAIAPPFPVECGARSSE